MTDVSALIPTGALLARPDLAEQALEGLVRATAWRPVTAMQVVTPTAAIRSAPESDAGLIDEIVFGEGFDMLESRGPRCWGRARRDGAVGWIDRAALGPVIAPDARVSTLRAPARTRALAESEVSLTLPWNALVSTGNRRDGYVQVAGAGWVAEDDLADLNAFDPDPATAAERLLGVRHVLGGRSPAGTDCSGLVQQALFACGLPGGRYSSDQAQLGQPIEAGKAQRGDLVIWPKPDLDVWRGHSAIVYDADHVIHATGHHGSVVVEAGAEAEDRYAADGFDAPVYRRVNLA